MWTRKLLKTNAKQALSGRYWRCFLVCLVLSLFGIGSFGSQSIGNSSNLNLSDSFSDYFDGFDTITIEPSDFTVWALIGGGVLLIIALCVAYSLFVVSPLAVGRDRYFMENRQSVTPFSTITSVFHTPYLNMVKVLFLVNLQIFVGYLLLIVPGIYWSFCYRQVPYLLAENPYLTASRAKELSRQMMDGEKWNTFVLDLSFLGWRILAALCLGIGLLFLEPYVQATNAELYAALRSKALVQGFASSEELGGFVRHDAAV